MNKHDLYAMFQKGFQTKQAGRVSEGGDWRGGNSGCITDNDEIIGACPRRTVLRHLGIESQSTLDDDLIFAAGFMNEDHLTELLSLAEVPFKCEEDIPVKWALPNGQTVTGRPDIVVGSRQESGEFVPELGVEVKLVSSNGKMVRHAHFASGNPSPGHVCQAAHYSWQMGIPWTMCYVSRAHYAPYFFSGKEFAGKDHRAVMRSKDGGKVVNVTPFISLYDLTWQDDTLLVDGQQTVITQPGIQRFYQYCSDAVKNRFVPDYGGFVDIWGDKEKKNNSIAYDPFAEARTDSFEDWVDDCREIAKYG